MTEHENNIPLSLYVHIPWCIKKCPYCDFNSHEIKNTLPEEQYIDSLILDLKTHTKAAQNRKVTSVFIGGAHLVFLKLRILNVLLMRFVTN